MTDSAAKAWSKALADALQAQDLPAQASEAAHGDWRLVLSAEMANGQAATLQQAAAVEAPKVIALLNGIEARRQMSDPHSLLNRPPVVYFKGVTGAPGDGNTALARLMITKLPNLGDVVQDTAKGADFTVEGQVKTAPGANKTERIELQWIITDDQGRERGRVVQLNEVPPGSLDSYWGEVAVVVANEAAGGVHEVVVQASGRSTNATPAPGSVPGAVPAS